MTDLNATWNTATRGPRMSEATGKVIFKYQMPVKEVFHVELPKGAQIIKMADQDGYFWLWAVVNTEAPMERRFFRAFKTGAKIPDEFDTDNYKGFCAVFVQMELGLWIFEDLKRYEDEQAYDYLVNVATKSDIVHKAAERRGTKVIDIKLSTMEPTDLRGIPMPETEVKPFHDYLEDNGQGEFFNWARFSCDVMGYDIYKTPSKKSILLDIDGVLTEFADVLKPMFDQQKAKPMNQKNIDEIEAQGGFEEEDQQ